MSPERSPVFTRSGDLPGVATSARAEGTERTIETVEVRTLQAFDRLRPAWDALVERLDLPSPFHSWEWNRRWWDHFGTGKRLRLLLFNRGRSLIGIAQFYERRIPLVAGGVLVPLGWEDTARKQGLSEQWELLFPTADRPELWEALGSWLTRTRWTAAVLPSLGAEESLPPTLARYVAGRGQPVSSVYRELPDTWEAFERDPNKSMRDNVRYYPRLTVRSGHACR